MNEQQPGQSKFEKALISHVQPEKTLKQKVIFLE